MFDFDASKLFVIGIIALLVIGPKELPRVLRQVGQYIAKMRRMAGEFQQQFTDAMRESELQELKKDMEKMAEDAKVDMNYDMAGQTQREIHDAIDQAGKPAAVQGPFVNPTPENDPDSVFSKLDIPPPSEPLDASRPLETAAHAPLREVGLESDPVSIEPAAPVKTAAPAKVHEA